MINIESIKSQIDELRKKNNRFKNINFYIRMFDNFELILYYCFGIGNDYTKEYSDIVDYIDILTKEQMPTLAIARQKGKLIKNTRLLDLNINLDKEISYPLNTITFYELLGVITILDKDMIDELIENGKEDIYGQDIKALEGKKVIFICLDNIKEFCNNFQLFEDYYEASSYFKSDINLDIDFDKDIKSNINEDKMMHFVLLHELGHAYFHCINDSKDMILRERQANYFASVALDGIYDNIIELINNRVEEYKNPLLKNHMYTKGITYFTLEREKLYGDEND